jgi:hypothetical protein
MSEKIYVWLLRFFPSHFREAYGEDALQLFRDRARDEKGFLPSLRLWLDLLADLAISVPREYFYAEPELMAASGQRLGSTPSFYVFGDESPRPGALLLGSVLSLAALATFSVLLSHGGGNRPHYLSARQGTNRARSLASEHPVPQTARDMNSSSGGEDQAIASRPAQPSLSASAEPAMAATPYRPNQAMPHGPLSNAALSPDSSQLTQALTPQLRDAPSPTPTDAAPGASPARANASRTSATAEVQDVGFDAAERHRVVSGAVANLKLYYVYPDLAQKMSDALLAHEKHGDDNAASDGGSFAELLAKQMRDVSHDLHLSVVYSQTVLPEHPSGPTAKDFARYRQAMKHENCTFEKVEILPHNIGYLKLNSFPDTSVCQSTATEAMRRLTHVNAIIFDLRDNTGGFPNMVALMAAYLFDHPVYFYNPRENILHDSWTQSPVPGNNLADKPAYILTSSSTFSGAEQFCYNLKMLKRATLIGETTHGGAHAGVWHRIDDHFGMGIPEVKPINPYSNADWEGTGVEPDIKVNAADALKTAERLASSKLRQK